MLVVYEKKIVLDSKLCQILKLYLNDKFEPTRSYCDSFPPLCVNV